MVLAAVSQPADADRLALVSLRGYEDSSGYQHVTGQVTNISDASLENITVVVSWYSDWGDLVTMREGPLSDGRLVPGQATAFEIRGPALPYATTYSAAFMAATGDTLLDVDSSWKEVR